MMFPIALWAVKRGRAATFRAFGSSMEPHIKSGQRVKVEPVEERAVVNDVTRFLGTLLASGPVAATECLRQARAAGISEKTLRRAKNRLRIESIREGDGLLSLWLWQMPRKGAE